MLCKQPRELYPSTLSFTACWGGGLRGEAIQESAIHVALQYPIIKFTNFMISPRAYPRSINLALLTFAMTFIL